MKQIHSLGPTEYFGELARSVISHRVLWRKAARICAYIHDIAGPIRMTAKNVISAGRALALVEHRLRDYRIPRAMEQNVMTAAAKYFSSRKNLVEPF